MKTVYSILLSFAVALFMASCGGNENAQTESASPEADVEMHKGQSAVQDDVSQKNILQIAIGSPDHSTLVAAVQAAGLENSLVNAGPFTVFAPINSAFDALPAGTVENLLKPENKAQLSSILKHHVTTSSYTMEMFKDGQSLWVADGGNVEITKSGDELTVGGAKVLGAVKASNGMVYVVDAVILP